MEYKEVLEIVVKDGFSHAYAATLNNGGHEQVRLFYKNGGIYRMPHRNRKSGYPLWGNSEWKSLKLVNGNKQLTDEELAKRMTRRAKDALNTFQQADFGLT